MSTKRTNPAASEAPTNPAPSPQAESREMLGGSSSATSLQALAEAPVPTTHLLDQAALATLPDITSSDPKINPRIFLSVKDLYAFATLISRMTTDEEMDGNMLGDDAVQTLGNLVASARNLVPKIITIDQAQGAPSLILTPQETLAVLTDLGVDFSDCVRAFATKQDDADAAYIAAARENHAAEGALEFDDAVIVSKGDDPGAYVMGWTWVTNEEAGIKTETDKS